MYTIEYTDKLHRTFEIEFSILGRYYPGTMIDPPEYPELEITNITYKGKNFFDTYEKKLSQKWLNKFYENIEIYCWDHAENNM